MEENSGSEDAQEKQEEEVEEIEVSEEEEEDNQKDHDFDSKFIFKKQDFVYQDIKGNTKDVNKKSKKMKVKKFDLFHQIAIKQNYCQLKTPDQSVLVQVQCVSLPVEIQEFLLKNEQLLRDVLKVEKKHSLHGFLKELVRLVDLHI